MERDLVPGARVDASGEVAYKVTVRTSDLKGAGTDADVHIEMFGRDDKGASVSSGRHKLDSSRTTSRGAAPTSSR